MGDVTTGLRPQPFHKEASDELGKLWERNNSVWAILRQRLGVYSKKVMKNFGLEGRVKEPIL